MESTSNLLSRPAVITVKEPLAVLKRQYFLHSLLGICLVFLIFANTIKLQIGK